jgi:hypothetical protein
VADLMADRNTRLSKLQYDLMAHLVQIKGMLTKKSRNWKFSYDGNYIHVFGSTELDK